MNFSSSDNHYTVLETIHCRVPQIIAVVVVIIKLSYSSYRLMFKIRKLLEGIEAKFSF